MVTRFIGGFTGVNSILECGSNGAATAVEIISRRRQHRITVMTTV
jgi:hypothetical protein